MVNSLINEIIQGLINDCRQGNEGSSLFERRRSKILSPNSRRSPFEIIAIILAMMEITDYFENKPITVSRVL